MTRERCYLPRHISLFLLPVLMTAVSLLLDVAIARAATIVVNHTGIAQNQDADCTLAEALNNADFDAQLFAGCAAGSGADTILFAIPPALCPGGTCTIATEVAYQITGPTIIDGYSQSDATPNTVAVGNNALIRIRLQPLTSSVEGALRVQSDDVTIRGLAIGGYSSYGIRVELGTRAKIVGCFIGTGITGTTAAANGVGILVNGPSISTTIGGTSPADRNVISGNTGSGIHLEGSSGATIQNNYVGLKAHGLDPLPNAIGLLASNSFGNTIGGTSTGAGNVVSGNTFNGIAVTAAAITTTTLNVIQGNYVGPRADGITGTTRNGNGIVLETSGNTVGGTAAGAGNTIVANSNVNVMIPGIGVGNAILGNKIAQSPGLGIDLGAAGVRPNDPRDEDTGPNNYQNYPDLLSVGVRANTTIHGSLSSTPNRRFRIELFSSSTCHSSNFGEGETYLGFKEVRTDVQGEVLDDNGNPGPFVVVLPQPLPVGTFITATATDLTTNDTSEFSRCRAAAQAGLRYEDAFTIPVTSVTTREADQRTSSAAVFWIRLASIPTANVTIPISISDPTEGIIDGIGAGPFSMTFTPANGTTSLPVRIVGVDDALDDGDIPYAVVIGQITSADPNYNGLNPPDLPATNLDDDNHAAQCGPRPRVSVSVVKLGPGQLRATISAGHNPNTQNEIQAITWHALTGATVTLDGVGAVQAGQRSTFPTLTQSASFTITRAPGAASGTVRLTVTDVCGDWPTVVGGGPNAW